MKLNRNSFYIQLKSGLAANVSATATKNNAMAGEPHYCTDTKDLYIYDGSAMQFIGGGSNKRVYTGSGTLTSGTSTTITDANVTSGSKIILQPTSSGIGPLHTYISSKSSGSFVIAHSTAAGSETFDYIVVN